jgi:hypothetical protein
MDDIIKKVRRMKKALIFSISIFSLLILLTGCPDPVSAPDIGPTPTPEATAEPTPDGTPEGTAEPTPEGTLEGTPEVTPEPTAGTEGGVWGEMVWGVDNWG